jgi:hypothetical protein
MPEIVVSSLDSSMIDSSLTFSFGRTKSTEPRTRDVLVSPSMHGYIYICVIFWKEA